jgi:hypothetical protein
MALFLYGVFTAYGWLSPGLRLYILSESWTAVFQYMLETVLNGTVRLDARLIFYFTHVHDFHISVVSKNTFTLSGGEERVFPLLIQILLSIAPTLFSSLIRALH